MGGNYSVILSFVFLVLATTDLSGQVHERQGWLFWSHEQTLTNKLKLFGDLQLRSADEAKYLETLLVRPGLTYVVNDNEELTVGYTLFANWEMEEDKKVYEPEHRIWEQYQVEMKLGSNTLSNRIRLEQRFPGQSQFSQRLRYYIKLKIPVFESRYFTAIQNEIFLNVQNKEVINNHLYDQNRLYGGIGYEFTKEIDLELGYMFRYQIEKESNVVSHILQLTISTNF
ncbi:DUF2490 domain-containing protein [Chryseosolibacter indicus]|uniref:DUF2490 domain-containing protein n=1 Tax=Chryseosolibacter indicus TaxID=2782351 RepID=A0ABS5VX34_9BACT|nr:DUF2490 domain-containing protein [Chryseosolibacter indicus]MBT1705975.1 DUF2490 domain-containing protein [Chryseosolibacter indicus]